MKKIIDAILEYQSRKNDLIKEYIGEDLIPHEVRLSEKDLRKKGVIDEIKIGFTKSHQLTDGNCLHCILFDDDCDKCPYSTILDDGCRNADSLYRRINEAWKKVEDEYAGDELEDLGDTLEETLSLY